MGKKTKLATGSTKKKYIAVSLFSHKLNKGPVCCQSMSVCMHCAEHVLISQ